MPLYLLASLGVLAFGAPWWVHRGFEASHRWQSRQISMDNAGLRLLRADAELLNRVEAVKRTVATLEKSHHPLHACARFVPPQPACITADRAAEATLEAYLTLVDQALLVAWRGQEAHYHASVEPLGLSLAAAGRPDVPPIKRARCSICGRQFRVAYLLTRYGWRQWTEALPRLFGAGRVRRGEGGWHFRLLSGSAE